MQNVIDYDMIFSSLKKARLVCFPLPFLSCLRALSSAAWHVAYSPALKNSRERARYYHGVVLCEKSV